MIRFACPKCDEINRCEDEDAGRVVTCSSCERKIRVPAGQAVQKKPARPQRKEEPEDEPEEDREVEEDRPKKKKKKASALLGPRQAVFQPNKGITQGLLGLFIVAGVAGLICFVLALLGPLADGGVALSIFLIPTGIIGALWCLNIMTLKVVLHEGGLVHFHRGKRRLIPWEDILSVKQAITEVYHNGGYVGTNYHYTLVLHDATKIVYTSNQFRKLEKLGNEIMEKTTEVILPLAIRAYKKGEVVDFGPLGVSRDGLHYGKSLLDWDAIKGVKIKEGYISVSKRGKWLNWCNISAASIPNLHVFLSLVNRIVGVDDD
jgi:hypothetical protein